MQERKGNSPNFFTFAYSVVRPMPINSAAKVLLPPVCDRMLMRQVALDSIAFPHDHWQDPSHISGP